MQDNYIRNYEIASINNYSPLPCISLQSKRLPLLHLVLASVGS